MDLFNTIANATNPNNMKYSGNYQADLYQDQINNETEMRTAYYCDLCGRYINSDGFELNRFDAIDNYNIENEECTECIAYEKEYNHETVESKVKKINNHLDAISFNKNVSIEENNSINEIKKIIRTFK